MTNEQKIEYARERHAMAVANRDFPEAEKWQQHLVDMGAGPQLGIVNNSMQRFLDRLKEITAC